MSEEESTRRLRILGLNLYESRAYLALLSKKQLTAKGVGQFALIPQSRTYDILESLRRKGFAMATPASPPAYTPVSPGEVLGAYYDNERKKIQNRAAKIQEEAQARLESVREAYLELTKEFPRTPAEEQAVVDRVWVLKERENIEKTLVGFIKEAKRSVLRITKPPELGKKQPVDPFYIVGMENQRFLFEALERKVEMKWLSLTTEIPTFLGLDITEPPERRFLERDQDITEKFLLVDDHSVLLNLHDPMSSAYGFVALAMQSKAVSSIFLDHFEKLWSKARPLSDVLPKLKQLVDTVSREMIEVGYDRTDAMVYRTLAKSGAVSRDVLERDMLKKKVQPQKTQASCDKLIREGIIYREPAFRVMMVEHPSTVRAFLEKRGTKPDRGRGVTTRRGASGKNP